MNLPEMFECDYSTYNIYNLNEELKKLNSITETDLHQKSSWNHVQRKEYTELESFLNDKYPTSSNERAIPDWEKEKNRAYKKQRYKELLTKIYKENKYYFDKKDELIEKINKYKTLLLANSKDKRKQKALTEIVCECGSLTNKSHLSRHKKTPLHLKRMEKNLLCTEIKEPVKEVVKEPVKEPVKQPVKELIEHEDEDEDFDFDESESESETEEEKENKYYNMPLIVTEEQEEQFRELYNVKWHTKLIIKKNIEWRQKWYKDNDVLFPIYKLDQNGKETKEVIGIC